MKLMIVPKFTKTKLKLGMIRKFLEKSFRKENLSYFTIHDSGYFHEN